MAAKWKKETCSGKVGDRVANKAFEVEITEMMEQNKPRRTKTVNIDSSSGGCETNNNNQVAVVERSLLIELAVITFYPENEARKVLFSYMKGHIFKHFGPNGLAARKVSFFEVLGGSWRGQERGNHDGIDV